jgi:hypothetical protein
VTRRKRHLVDFGDIPRTHYHPSIIGIRAELVDLRYRCTISQIISSSDAIAQKFAKHGFALKSKQVIASLLN